MVARLAALAQGESALRNELPAIKKAWCLLMDKGDLANLKATLTRATELLGRIPEPQKHSVIKSFLSDAKGQNLSGEMLLAAVRWLGQEGSAARLYFMLGEKAGMLGVIDNKPLHLSTGPRPTDVFCTELKDGLGSIKLPEALLAMKKEIRRTS
jgi:hypothetical protein